MENQEQNTNRNFMKTHYNDNKLDKSNEINNTMTIKSSEQDEYTRKIRNLGGNQ